VERLQSDELISTFAQVENTQDRIGQIQTVSNEFDRFVTIVLIITLVLVATTIYISVRTFFVNEQRTVGILKILGQPTKHMIILYG
jgi:predicted lysophospholipase L1 biosynthesis ABC-type transport system permease subunit